MVLKVGTAERITDNGPCLPQPLVTAWPKIVEPRPKKGGPSSKTLATVKMQQAVYWRFFKLPLVLCFDHNWEAKWKGRGPDLQKIQVMCQNL